MKSWRSARCPSDRRTSIVVNSSGEVRAADGPEGREVGARTVGDMRSDGVGRDMSEGLEFEPKYL